MKVFVKTVAHGQDSNFDQSENRPQRHQIANGETFHHSFFADSAAPSEKSIFPSLISQASLQEQPLSKHFSGNSNSTSVTIVLG
jgi:hypothetical protein